MFLPCSEVFIMPTLHTGGAACSKLNKETVTPTIYIRTEMPNVLHLPVQNFLSTYKLNS